LHPIDDLRAKDDFEIRFTPVDANALHQLFQTCFIRQEFAGGPGSAACDSGHHKNYLAGGLVGESGGYCIVFDNIALRSH